MADLNVFGKGMKGVAKNFPNAVNRTIQQMAGGILQALVSATPVDTGHARANWQVGVGAPIDDELDPTVRTGPARDSKGRFTGGPRTTTTTERSAQATLTAGKSALSARQPEQPIFITNNVPYIGRLNEGWSAQAPAGFVQIAIQSALSRFQGLVK